VRFALIILDVENECPLASDGQTTLNSTDDRVGLEWFKAFKVADVVGHASRSVVVHANFERIGIKTAMLGSQSAMVCSRVHGTTTHGSWKRDVVLSNEPGLDP
jgi:hypothetical protein